MNKDYIVISSGLFKDHKEEEFILLNGLTSDGKAPTYTSLTAEDLRITINAVFNERRSRRSSQVLYAGVEAHRQFQEALQGAVQRVEVLGTAGEMSTAAEEMWTDIRNENREVTHNPILDTQSPTVEYIAGYDPYTQVQDRDSITITRNMTEEEIINYFDTISNE